jgi:cbb3-type cytochrome oxidase maturation protein
MSVIYIVLPLALAFAGIAVWAFIWAVRQGQLDDLETPAARILLDDDPLPVREPETVSHRGSGGGLAGPRGRAGR